MVEWDTSKVLSYQQFFHPDMLHGSKDFGIAISGGGARSCAVVVGMLRGLHERGVLSKVQLMSLVSGGAFGVSGFLSYLYANRAKKLGCQISELDPFIPSDDEILDAINDVDHHMDRNLSKFFFFGRRVLFSTLVGLLTSIVVWVTSAWLLSQSANYFAGSCLRSAVEQSIKENDGTMSWFRPRGFAYGCVLGYVAEGALIVMRWPLGSFVNVITAPIARLDGVIGPWDLSASAAALLILIFAGAIDQILWEFIHIFRISSRHPVAYVYRAMKAIDSLVIIACLIILVWDIFFELIYVFEFLLRPLMGKLTTLDISHIQGLPHTFTVSISQLNQFSVQYIVFVVVIVILMVMFLRKAMRNVFHFFMEQFVIIIWLVGFILMCWLSVFQLEESSAQINISVLVVSVLVLAYYGLSAKNKHSYYSHLVRDVYLAKEGRSVCLNDLAKLQKPSVVINGTVHNVCLRTQGDDPNHLFTPPFPRPSVDECGQRDDSPLILKNNAPPPAAKPLSARQSSSFMLMPAVGRERRRRELGGGVVLRQRRYIDDDERVCENSRSRGGKNGSCLWPCDEGWEMGPRSVFMMSGDVAGAPGLGFRKTSEYIGYWPLSEAVAVSASFWTGVVEITGPLRSIGGRFSLFLYNWSLGRWFFSPKLLPSKDEPIFLLLKFPFLNKYLMPSGTDKNKRLDSWIRLLKYHKYFYRSVLLAMPALMMFVSLLFSSLPLSVAAVASIIFQHFGGLWSGFVKRIMHFQSWFANHYMVLGVNTSDCPFHYLSDGGHFDNLGLTTLLMARVKNILLFDNGRDDDRIMDDLFHALEIGERRVGVSFTMDPAVSTLDELRLSADQVMRMEAEKELRDENIGPNSPTSTAKRVLKIIVTYPPQSEEELAEPFTSIVWYVKTTTLTEEVPIKLRLYALSNPQFPNHPTIDVYDSQRYRAYRDLGRSAAHELCDTIAADPSSKCEFV